MSSQGVKSSKEASNNPGLSSRSEYLTFPLWSHINEMFVSRAFYYMSVRVLGVGTVPLGPPHGACVKSEM